MPPVGAIAVVALDRHHGLTGPDQLVRLDVGHRHGDRRERLGLVVGPAQAPTHHDGEALQPAIGAAHRDDGEVLRIDVDAVVAFQRDRGLELARQVGLPVERLRLGFGAGGQLAIDPDLSGWR